jgi:hypothetical protein
MSADTPNTEAPFPGSPVGNRQDGRVLGQGDPAEADLIATGDRHDEVWLEPDPDQLVVARHLSRLAGPLPPEEQTPGAAAADADSPPIEDVAVAPEGPSVWDARPPADDADKSGTPTGH